MPYTPMPGSLRSFLLCRPRIAMPMLLATLLAGFFVPRAAHAQEEPDCQYVTDVYFEKLIPLGESDGLAIALFGVHTAIEANIPIGADNYLSPPPASKGQPTTFDSIDRFGVIMDLSSDVYSQITWTLCGQKVTASAADLDPQGTPLLALATADGDTTLTVTDAQLRARLPGGVRFYTEASGEVGVALQPGGAGWAVTSDSTKKEHFQKADGERFLDEIRRMHLGSWSYRVQPDTARHYGPTAQAFYDAFGRDGIGTVGTDTTIAGADADGVLFIAVQALERRTRALQEENAALAARVAALERQQRGGAAAGLGVVPMWLMGLVLAGGLLLWRRRAA